MNLSQTDPLALATKQPDIKALSELWQHCGPISRINPATADGIRFCYWPNQSPDGKKHDRGDSTAFPWEGASDTRPMVVDGIINEQVCMLTTSFWRAMVKPKAADDEVGQYAVSLVDYFINEVLSESLVSEVELSAQYREHYGWFVLNPGWEQKLGMRRQKIKLQELDLLAKNLRQQIPEQPILETLGASILEPALEEPVLEAIQAVYRVYALQQLGTTWDIEVPELSSTAIRRALTELRKTSEAEIAVPYVCYNGPTLAALRPWDEIFVPNDTTNLECARGLVQREWVTEAELRARVKSQNYNAKWVEKAVMEKGRGTKFWDMQEGMPGSAITAPNTTQVDATTSATTRNDLIEVLHAVHRAVDEDNVPAVYCTTFHASIVKQEDGEPSYAKHELLNYPHGQYPYVGGAREYWCRRFTASRGIPEIAGSWQQELKVATDSVIDRSSITVLPPVNVYMGPGGSKYKFGPAVQNTVVPGREPQFMQMPSGQGMSDAMMNLEVVASKIDNYFGLLSTKVPPARTQMMQAKSVLGFLMTWSKALGQLVALAQRYMPDAEFARVTGAKPGWLDERRDKPGLMNAELTFDVRELDPELTTQRIEAMNKVVLPSDVSGVLNRSKWTEIQVRTINPGWARELLMDANAASQGLYEKVRNDIAQMFLGNEVQYVKDDPTAGSKLQYASQIVAANPMYQQALQQEGRFSTLMQAYSKNLSFSVTQDRNKQIGAIGVVPVSQQPQG